MSRFPSPYTERRGFFVWEELGYLARACGFTNDLFERNYTSNNEGIGEGLSKTQLEVWLETNALDRDLHRTANFRTSSQNVLVFKRAARLISTRKLTFQDIYDGRIAFDLYDGENDHEGLYLKDLSLCLRALKMANRAATAAQLPAELRRVCRTSFTPACLQLPDFLELMARFAPIHPNPAIMTPDDDVDSPGPQETVPAATGHTPVSARDRQLQRDEEARIKWKEAQMTILTRPNKPRSSASSLRATPTPKSRSPLPTSPSPTPASASSTPAASPLLRRTSSSPHTTEAHSTSPHPPSTSSSPQPPARRSPSPRIRRASTAVRSGRSEVMEHILTMDQELQQLRHGKSLSTFAALSDEGHRLIQNLEQRHRTMPASVVEAQQKKEAEQKQEQKQEQEAAQKQGKVQRKEQPRQRRASVAGHVPVRRSARRMTATEIDTSFGRRASRIGQLSSRAESGLDSVNGDEHHTDIDGESLNLPASVDASRRASAHHSPTRRARRPSARDHPLVREALAVQPELASNLDLQTESQRPLVTERDRLLQAAEVEDLEWDMACANDPELRKILRERRVSTISDHSQEDGDGDVGHRRGSMRRPSGAMSVGRHRRRPSRASTVWAAYPHDEEEDQIVKVQVREDGEEEEEETASSRALAGLILEEDEDSPLSLGSSPSRVRGSLSPLGRLSVLSTRSSIFDTTPPPQSTPPPSFQVSLPPSSPKRSPYSHGLSSSSRRESIVESNLLNLEVRDWHQPNKWDP